MTKIRQMRQYLNEEPENIEDIHPFHMHFIEACGVGYYSFKDFLNNLEEKEILEELDEFIKNNYVKRVYEN